MSRLNSFYLPPEDWPSQAGDTVTLDGSEARHMVTVLRSEKDQTVRLFDGIGRSGLFRIVETSKKRAHLETIQLEEAPNKSSGLTLAIGWGKSKRRNYLFEKVVELRGDGILFWEANRSQGHIPSAPKETWRDKCLQAAKQCGNPFVADVSIAYNGITDLESMMPDFDHCFLAWESNSADKTLSHADLAKGRSLIVIGPEGGLEEFEARRLMDAGFIPVTLGDSILRWETAATYCLSLGWYAKQV